MSADTSASHRIFGRAALWAGFGLLSVSMTPAWSAETVDEAPATEVVNDAVVAPAGLAGTSETEAHQRTMFEYLRHPDLKPVRSLLVDQEMPIVGIRWGAQVQFDVPLNSEPDGAEATLREARLVFYRGFGPNWAAKATANYNNTGKFEIGDTYVNYTGWKTFKATLGVFRPAYSLESTSRRIGLTFMERALPVAALSERRSGGISLTKRSSNAILDAGLYLFSPDDEGQREKGQAVVLHYVHAPLDPERGLGIIAGRDIWAGVSLSYRTNATGPNTRFRSLPEVHVSDDYFVDTGAIDNADRIIRLGLEANKVAGPFSWQAEILTTKVLRDNAPDVLFSGAYLFASWFLTGETRNYDSATGSFLGIKPNKPFWRDGWGAWELAVRASTVDLNDKDVVGGRQRDLTLGLNWYPDHQFRVQANLIKVLDVDRPGSEFDGAAPWIAALRIQWYLP